MNRVKDLLQQQSSSGRTDSQHPEPRRATGWARPPIPDRGSALHQEKQSSNSDFPGLVRHAFQFIQATHHYENWTEVPPRVEQAIDKIVANLKPPMPGPEVEAKLAQAAADFKSSLTVAIQAHLHACATSTKQQLKELDPTDWEIAEEKAVARYRKRLGTRARQATVTEAIQELRQVNYPLEDAWKKPKRTAKQPHTSKQAVEVEVHNRFDGMETDDVTDSLSIPDPDDSWVIEYDRQLAAEAALRSGANALPTQKRARNPSAEIEKQDKGDKRKSAAGDTPETDGRPAPPLPSTTDITPVRRGTPAPSTLTTSTPATPRSPPATTGTTPSLATPTASPRRPCPKVLVGHPEDRTRWTVRTPPEGVRNAVLTDSNGVCWADLDLPSHTVVYAYRGARLVDGVHVLSQAVTIEDYRAIAILLGINDRLNDPKETLTQFHKLHNIARHSSKTIRLIGIPDFPSLPSEVRACVVNMNRAAHAIFGERFIPPLPAEAVTVVESNTTNWCYDASTASRILESIRHLLK